MSETTTSNTVDNAYETDSIVSTCGSYSIYKYRDLLF